MWENLKFLRKYGTCMSISTMSGMYADHVAVGLALVPHPMNQRIQLSY